MAQKTEVRQSQAVLAEIRDTLLETYASNDGMNQVILSSLEPRAWRAEPPGKKGNGSPDYCGDLRAFAQLPACLASEFGAAFEVSGAA